MKCPHCGGELYDGAKFCNACGAPVKSQSRSRGAEIAVALLKAVCFVLYFFGVQSIIVGIYSFMTAFRVMLPQVASGTLLPDDAVTQVYELLGAYMHETLILSAILTVLILGLIYRLRGKRMSDEILLRRADPMLLGKVALCAIGFQFFISIGVSMLPLPDAMFESFEEMNALLNGGSIAMQLLNVAIFTPIVEEVIFRGFIFTRLRKVLPAAASALISGAIFGLVHGHPISFVYATALGFFMAMLMERFQSILPCIMCHIAFNGSSFITMLFPDNAALLVTIFAVSLALTVVCVFWIFGLPQKRRGHAPR